MRRVILFTLLMLASSTLFAVEKTQQKEDILRGKTYGDTLKGKEVKYLVCKYEMEGVYVLRNIKNKDTSTVFVRAGLVNPIPEHMQKRVLEVLIEQLTPEEYASFEKAAPYSIGVRCRMTENGKVKELCFFIFAVKKISMKQMDFWLNLPADRYHEMEKAIIAEIDESGQEWTRSENLGCPLEECIVDVCVDFTEGRWVEGNGE